MPTLLHIFLCSLVVSTLGEKVDDLRENSENLTSPEPDYRRTDEDNLDKLNDKNSTAENIENQLSVLPKENTETKIENNDQNNNRKLVKEGNMLQWFKNTFSEKTVKSTNIISVNKTDDLFKELKKLINRLEELTENFVTLDKAFEENDGYIVVRLPSKINKKNVKNRFRRTTEQNVQTVLNDTVDIENKTEYLNTRRNLDFNVPAHSIREKLLMYLDESLEDILKKVKTLEMLKQSLADNPIFKIGYIVANIDTLMVNLDIMKKDMNTNRALWEDKKILDVFDKLKAAENMVSRLLEPLKQFVNI